MHELQRVRVARLLAIGLLAVLCAARAAVAAPQSVTFDRGTYPCGSSSLTVTVVDPTGNPASVSAATTVKVFDEAGTLVDTESLTFSGSGGTFSGTAPISEGTPTPGDGLLQGVRFLGRVDATDGPITATASACKPTTLTGTAGGSINGIAISATVTGQMDYDQGVGIFNITPIPPSLGHSLTAYTGLGTVAGSMSAITDPGAQTPGKLTRANFTRDISISDSRSGRVITYHHVVSYPQNGNSVSVALTLGGEIETLPSELDVLHQSWNQSWIPAGTNIALDQVQTMKFIPATGSTILPPTLTFTHARPPTWFPTIFGTIHPNPTAIAAASLVSTQYRFVDRISVTYDLPSQTLTIVSKNRMSLTPHVLPALSTWGIIGLFLLLAVSVAILLRRNRTMTPRPAA